MSNHHRHNWAGALAGMMLLVCLGPWCAALADALPPSPEACTVAVDCAASEHAPDCPMAADPTPAPSPEACTVAVDCAASVHAPDCPMAADPTPAPSPEACTATAGCAASEHTPDCPMAADPTPTPSPEAADPTPTPLTGNGRTAFSLQIITGFADAQLPPIQVARKLPQDELGLPDTLSVYLAGSETPVPLPVTWVCDTDYETSEASSFTFTPQWDEGAYALSPDLQDAPLPTCTVSIQAGEGTTILVEGAAVSRTGIQAAVDAALADYDATERPAGDVTLVLNPANKRVSVDFKDGFVYLSVPTDKGITSFTVTSTLEGATRADPVILYANGYMPHVYANGIPFIVSGPINLGGKIFGGSAGQTTGSTSITYDGASGPHNRTMLYGGGYNGDVTGSTTIRVLATHALFNNGVTFTVCGGGRAEGAGASACVSGNTNLELYAPVVNVLGGGSADYGGVADVGGDTFVHFFPGSDLAQTVNGGGSATNTPSNSGKTTSARVSGVCHVTVDAPLTQSLYNGDMIVGGGHAALSGSSLSELADSASIADVGGVDVRLNADITTNVQPNTFYCVLGGGDVDGRLYANPNAPAGMDVCRAAVLGDVHIQVAPGATLNRAIIGGGYTMGGDVNVQGTVHLTLGDGVKIGGMVGGGVINCNASRPANADVGGVSIALGDGVTCNDHFMGGGSTRYQSSSYAPAGSHANVNGSIRTDIGARFACSGWFYGGGVSWVADTITQTQGSIATSMGADAVITGQFTGGGAAEAANADAQVMGNITNTFAGNFTCSYFTGAGRTPSGCDGARSSVGHAAQTRAAGEPVQVLSAFTGVGATATFQDFAVAAGRAYSVADATVYGNSALLFAGVAPNRSVYGGGYGNAGTADVTGVASLTFQDVVYGPTCYGGGAAANNGSAKVGSATVRMLGQTTLSNGIWKGSDTVTDGLTVYCGDGETPTQASLPLIYDDKTNLHVTNHATLTHLNTTTNRLLWNAQDVQVDQGGTLILTSHDESLAGNFTGGGSLQMEAGQKLTIGGTVFGMTSVHINGEPSLGQVYIEAGAAEMGDVFFMENGLKLAREEGETVWKIMGMQPPSITTATLPGGRAGESYRQTLAAEGDGQMTWTVQGDLPPGLTLEESGLLSGIPTTPGTYAFTVTASNGADPDDQQALSLTILPAVYAVTIDVYLDGQPWTEHGKALALQAQDGTVLTDLTAVVNGEYRLLSDGQDTGLSVSVEGAPAQADLRYYTVLFSAVDAGTAQGSTVTALYRGQPLSSGAVVLPGGTLLLSAQGAGAQSYTYRWSGREAEGPALSISALDGRVDAVCTVTGVGVATPPPTQPGPLPSASPTSTPAPTPTSAPGAGSPATGDAGWPLPALLAALAACLCACGLALRRGKARS